MEPLEDRRMLATLTVNVDDDGVITDDGNLLLREAIAYVNRTDTPGAADLAQINLTEAFGINDKIIFDSGLDGGTIDLNQTLGEFSITDSVTINASMLSSLTIDAGGGMDGTVGNGDGFRIFNITGDSDTQISFVTLKGLTLTGGDVSGIGVYANYSCAA